MQATAGARRGFFRVAVTRGGLAVAALAFIVHAACSTDAPEAASSPDGGAADGAVSAADGGGAGPADGGGDSAPAACTDDGKKADCTTDGGTLPSDLRCIGLYSCWSPKTVAATALAYKPGIELWSDGAEKSRWITLPPGTKIDITQPDGWVFPVGTKVFKEFKVGGKRLETRIFQKFAGTGPASDPASNAVWEAAVYRWSADGESSATRMDNGELIDGYEIPSTKVCIRCHQGRSDRLLGIEAWSLAIPGATGLTMAKLKELDLVAPSPETTTRTIPEDATGKAAEAIGWLHANCGYCHNERTGSANYTGLFMDLVTDSAGIDGVEGTAVWQTAMNQPMRAGGKFEANTAFAGFLRMTQHDSTTSLVPVVDALREDDGGVSSFQMPPILVRKVDPKGASVKTWIDALPAL